MSDEVEVTTTIRNNRLKRLRLGLRLTQRTLWKATGVPLHRIAAAEQFKPILPRHSFALVTFFDVEIEYLFPPKIVGRIERASVVTILSGDALVALAEKSAPPLFEDPLEKAQLAERVSVALASLTPREEMVMRKRYYDGDTLEEVGQAVGVNRERVRMIEAKALRKLRHPSRADKIKEAI